MKRRFTLILAALWLLTTSSICFAQTATFTPSTSWDPTGTSGTGSLIEATVDGVTFSCDKGFVTTQIRCYKNGVITISSENTITQLDFTFSGSNYTGGLDASYTGLSTNEWTQTLGSQARFTSIVVTYSNGGGQQTVAAPTFSPAAGTYYEAQNVSINCATEGATIYYTTDGNDPTTASAVYSAPIAISETTTVKAMGVKAGMTNSSVATATYTIQQMPAITTIADLWEFAATAGSSTPSQPNANVTFNDWYVTGVKNSQVCVSDGQYGFVIYQSGHGFVAGDKLNGTVACKVMMYQNHYAEVMGVKASDLTVVSGQEMPVLTTTIAALEVRNYGTAIDLGTCSYNGIKFYDAAGDSIALYNNFNLNPNPINALEAGKQYTVKGVSIIYWQSNNQTQQIAPRSADDFEEVVGPTEQVATPTFTPVEGTYTEAQDVTISTTTEGATIYYTLDGTTPTTNSSVYSTAITISETTTVKAFAVKADMIDSEVATAEYTINIVPPTPTETSYKLITNANALISGDKYIIVGIKGETYKALGKQGTNNRPAVTVTPSNDTITVTPASAAGEDAVYELTLGQEGNYWTLYDAANEGYLYAASSSANHLKVQAENDANGQWTIEIASSGVATIKAQGTNTRNWLRLNNNGSPFSCYASGQLDVYLYKAGEVPTPPTPTNYTVSVADGITNGTVTVNPTSAAENDTIAVTATPANNYELATLTYTYAGVATPIDIDQTTMKFIMPAADVTVNATFSELATVATPTFTPAAGSYISVQTVSLACATEGASIYYTLDGTDPTTESTVYAEAFTVSTTTTVKAMAVKEGMNNSAIASVTYTIIEPMTIAAARALENNQYALVQGVVTFIDGRNIYVQDATAGIDLYLNNNTVPSTLAIGDMVKGYGKKTVYNGLTELTAINGGDENQFLVLSSGNPLPVAVKTITEILEDHAGDKMLQSTRVQIVEATVGTINNSNNTPISQGDNTLNIYKLPVVEGLLEGDIVTVTGIVGCYNNPQLRVASAADVTFTHPSGITITPSALSGFNYVYEEGPSTVKTFVISGMNLSAPTYIHASENYEISSFPGESFYPESTITINTYTGVYNYTIKVRLKAGLEVGDYNESIMICEDEVDTLYVALSGSVTNTPPQPQGDYTRLTDLSLLTSGSKVIFAARYNETANEYYAMTAQASGKPEGVLFTSETTNVEVLPAEIVNAEETYYWTVDVNGANYTFTNANGDVLGYTSGTNFATGGDNTAWAITYQTSEASAMVPNYSAFVINNVNNAVRAIALNSNHNFGPYHTQNMGADNYNFFLDMFATVGGGTLTCTTPTFTPEAGTYFETQEVAIACNTADATIYYTTDGTEPDETSSVYTEPITVAESMTIKAIAMKEGYENSNIATAEYTIILGAVTIFSQYWEGDMNGWTFVTVEGGNAWTIAQYSGNHYAYANGYNGGVNEQWCISPAFDLNVYSNASLSFRNAKNYNGPDMQLYFSNNYDGENPASATWTELEFNKSTGSYAWAESGSIDLASFTGDECYIGFKYTSTETEAAAWEVDDIVLMGFTTEPYLTVTPNALSGFSYIVGNGPSAAQTFTVSGGNLPPAPGGTSGGVNISISNSNFELSLDGEVYSNNLSIEVVGTLEPTTVYVRLEAGLPVYEYIGMIFIEDGGTIVSVSVIGNVIEEPQPGGDWNRIYALTDLHDGDQVILAARYDATVGNGYYAMPAVVTGKPDGVLFTSVNNGGVEQLPAEISDNADTYLWNVTIEGDVITLVNAAGDSLGYSSSTNFAGNTNTEWNIALQTSEEGALIPNYTGFVITNGTTTNRGIAKNASHKFGAYAVSNMTSADYNFFLDLFVYGGSVTPTVATPVFSMASGTYYEAIEVEITCSTEGATIYYTLDGTDPTAESEVYTEALVIEETTTIKAIAMKEGYDNSGIATANYVIMNNIEVIVSQDWEGEMNGWTFVTVEGNKPWTIGSYSGNHYANANGYNDDVDNEQWCISPAFNLSGRTDHNVTLTFRNAMKFTGPALELYFANDYDGEDPTSADWQPLSFTMSEGNYTWTESGEISLNAFDGEQCYIGFRYLSTIEEGAASWEVDDILIVADMGTDPYLSATPNALSGFVQNLGEPSEAQTFVLTGGNLPTGFLTLTVNNGFEISFDGDLYTGVSTTIPVDNPTLEPTTIYVRLNGEEIGDYEGAIIIDVNDDVTTTVSVRGTVTGDGIDETLASTVSVWNNNNELMIANDGNEELNVVVYNLIGQPVLSETVATGTNVIRHDLVEGVYIVRIANGKEMTGIKVVVRR